MSNEQPFFPLNDEHMRNKVGVVRTNQFASYSKKRPVIVILAIRFLSFVNFFLEKQPMISVVDCHHKVKKEPTKGEHGWLCSMAGSTGEVCLPRRRRFQRCGVGYVTGAEC